MTKLSVVTVVVLVLALAPRPAAAGSGSSESTPETGGGVDDGVPYAVVILGGGGVLQEMTTSGGGSAWSCIYWGATAVSTSNPIPVADPAAEMITPEEGQVVVLRCVDAVGDPVYENVFVFDPGEPFGTLLAAEQAAALAREQLVLPTPDIQMSPPRDAPHLVGLASWFYVDTPWVDQSESAGLAGVTSTVTAVPVSMSWDPGDGTDVVECDGPGMAWQPDTDAPCAYTYLYGGTYTVGATITWDANWSATNGQSGALGTITTTASWDITVRQAQAVLSN